ncbi:unnamed protein product [Lymnaea stagnalis]|uniref:Uncharacterized protein n=1 Tax=Lymnaea stagnalis TaxID=6523 RepID=A0AAV2HF46_LYMST
MGDYTCRLVTSWIMFGVAFSLLLVAILLPGWSSIGEVFIFDDRKYSGRYQFFDPDFSTAMMASLCTSISLTALCFLLSFIMMCADCCCKVTQCMMVIPKITMTMATLAGILAEVCAALFLINIYAVKEFQTLWTINILPGYCFYMTAATGIWLLIAGCTNFGARHATRVGVDNQQTVTGISVVGQQSQAAGMNSLYGQTQGLHMSGYFPPSTAMGDQIQGYPRPPTSMGYFPPQTAFYGPRLVLSNTSTQTSLVDIKKAAETVKK